MPKHFLDNLGPNNRRKQKGRRNSRLKLGEKISLKPKFPPPCDNDMTFHDCELAILRQATDEIETTSKRKVANSDEVKTMIEIVETFLKDTKCICYGGTAINNILPPDVQFYDRDIEVPDYDFYSKTPVEHAKQLADIYYKKGYTDVEAKAGVHFGTYKVFVNFIPMADITLMHEDLFDNLGKDAMTIQGINYASPNFLRMGMFLELSRPDGDVSRWEKVLKRLTLLNKFYPLNPNNCHNIDFQRTLNTHTEESSSKLYYIVRDSFIQQNVVFFGGYAGSLYAKYMPNDQKHLVKHIPDFDVLCENAELCASIVSQQLKDQGYANVKVNTHPAIGEIIPIHYELTVGRETLGFVYEPLACHNYNEIFIDGNQIRVATIDTILSFYLAFLYSNHAKDDKKYKDRLLCMSKFLFEVEQKNRLSQNGLLKRFSMSCYGKQPTLESIRVEKTEMFRNLSNKKHGEEWDRWFLKYSPGENKKPPTKTKPSSNKKKSSTLEAPTPSETKKQPKKPKTKNKKKAKTNKTLKQKFKRNSAFLF